MKWTNQEKNYLFAIATSIMTFLFVIGLWTIDIGASAQIMKTGLESLGVNMGVQTESLFGARPPYVTYHLGLLLVSLLFLTSLSINIYLFYIRKIKTFS